MRPRRSPSEKKRLSYEHDHPTYAEYPHAFRAKWPKKKAIAQRSFRRRAKRALTPDDDGVVDTVKRKTLWKWPPRSLGECVRDKLEGRAHHVAYNFFKQPYATAIHREPFTKFLEALMFEHLGTAREHARAMALNLYGGKWARWAERRAWLECYFADEPEMRGRLTSWVDMHTALVG